MKEALKPITSTKNPVVQWARAFASGAARAREGLFLVEGDKLLQEAVGSGLDIHTLFVREDRVADPLIQTMDATTGYLCSSHVMDALCDTKTPQGVAALVRIPVTEGLPEGRFYVLAERLQDPGNVGTLIRTADAAGVDAVILSSDSADPYSPKVVRASMGSLFHLPVMRMEMDDALSALKARQVFLMAGHLKGTDYYARPALPDKVALLVGNESQGLSDAVADQCDALYRLPIVRAESLNAAIAAAVMLFDVVREKGQE